MEKFLSIPVTDEQNQIVSANGIMLIEQTSATVVTLSYHSTNVVVITHATAGSDNETMRDAIQEGVLSVLAQDWKRPSLQMGNLPFAVSAIAASVVLQPTS